MIPFLLQGAGSFLGRANRHIDPKMQEKYTDMRIFMLDYA